jgi:hypothetical protein
VPPGALAVTNASGNVIPTADDTGKTQKTRYSDRMKEPKQKQAQEKAAKKKQKFVPPTETPAQQAQDKQEQAAVGLNGDTTKQKKPNPAKSGPKRRLSDQDKNGQPGAGSSGTPASTTPPASSTPPPQSTPPAQGTQPSQPQF